MADETQSEIDWQDLLKRLTVEAACLVAGKGAGDGRRVVVHNSGYSAEDMATDVWSKAYSGEKPLPADIDSTKRALGCLRKRLRWFYHDVTTRGRAQIRVSDISTSAEGTSTAAGGERRMEIEDETDEEGMHMRDIEWKKMRAALLSEVRQSGDVNLLRMAEMQCSEEGYLDIKRGRVAEDLELPPSEITNLQKKFDRIYEKLYPGQGKLKKTRRQGRRVRENGVVREEQARNA